MLANVNKVQMCVCSNWKCFFLIQKYDKNVVTQWYDQNTFHDCSDVVYTLCDASLTFYIKFKESFGIVWPDLCAVSCGGIYAVCCSALLVCVEHTPWLALWKLTANPFVLLSGAQDIFLRWLFLQKLRHRASFRNKKGKNKSRLNEA